MLLFTLLHEYKTEKHGSSEKIFIPLTHLSVKSLNYKVLENCIVEAR